MAETLRRRCAYFECVEYRILGPLEVRESSRLVEIPGVKERALLALLLVELGTVVSTDRVIYELWSDDPPKTVQATVRTLVSRLRKIIGKDSIVAERPGYRLTAAPAAVDSQVFEKLADEAFRNRAHVQAAERTSAEGLALWNGRALADLDGFDFAANESRRLEQRRLDLLELRLDTGMRMGKHIDLIPDIRTAVDQNPMHERFHGMLMLALYRSGHTPEALAVYRDLATKLGEELGIGPSHELRSIEAAIVTEDDSLDLDTPVHPHNLPFSLTSFVGRANELDALIEAVPDRRLLTLTGPGGSGKSRLAVEVGNRLIPAFPDGVWRVELAPLRGPDSIAPTISAVFGDPGSHSSDPLGSLTDLLGQGRLLMLLDNCEHLLNSVAPTVTTILETCPNLTILATSREPLGIAGESVWLVPPLRTPDPSSSIEEQGSSEAVRLFVSRARDVNSGFELDDDSSIHVFEICRMVDGLPLAIELAAARVSTMSVNTLEERLRSDLSVLSSGRGSTTARHETMTAALDWSYRLLDPRTAEVFCKLAVFRGGCTSKDVRSVLGDESMEIVTELVNRSLVERLHGRRLEYRLLEPIREYANQRFEQLSDATEVLRRHAATYLQLARRADRALRGPEQIDWLRLIEEEHDNMRAAIARSLDSDDIATSLELVAWLGHFWFMAGLWKESWDWLRAAIEQAGDRFPAERATAVYRTGAVQVIRVNHEAIMDWVHDALATCRSNGDRYGEAWCLHLIGHSLGFGSSPEGAIGPLTESRDIFAGLGCGWEVAWSNRFIGNSECDLGEMDEGFRLLLGSVSAFREMGDLWQTAYGLFGIGANLLVYREDGPTAARPYLLRCLRLSEQIGDRVWSAHAMSRLGLASLRAGDEDAETLLREAAERHRLIGDDACVASTFGYLGDLLENAGDESQAAGFFAYSIRAAQRIDATRSIAASFDRIARLAIKRGRIDEARRIVGAVQSAVDDGSLAHHPIYDPLHKEVVELLDVEPATGESIESMIPIALETAESIHEEQHIEQIGS